MGVNGIIPSSQAFWRSGLTGLAECQKKQRKGEHDYEESKEVRVIACGTGGLDGVEYHQGSDHRAHGGSDGPCKRGVGGGIVAVVPGRFAIAVYSPPLDSRGNSVRGVKVVEELSRRWYLHIFAPQRADPR